MFTIFTGTKIPQIYNTEAFKQNTPNVCCRQKCCKGMKVSLTAEFLFNESFTLLMLSMTLVGFGSSPSLAKVTSLEKQTEILRVNRLCKNLMIEINIFMLEDLYWYSTPESDYALLQHCLTLEVHVTVMP